MNQKTRKAIIKRLKLTKTKKLSRRWGNIGHTKAKDSRRLIRQKRKNKIQSRKTMGKDIKRVMHHLLAK